MVDDVFDDSCMKNTDNRPIHDTSHSPISQRYNQSDRIANYVPAVEHY